MANERAINVSQATQIARSVKGQLTDINGRLNDNQQELGFAVKNFSKIAGSAHSLTTDKLDVIVKSGQKFYITVSQTGSEAEFGYQLFAWHNGESSRILSARTSADRTELTADSDFEQLSVYVGNDLYAGSAEMTLLVEMEPSIFINLDNMNKKIDKQIEGECAALKTSIDSILNDNYSEAALPVYSSANGWRLNETNGLCYSESDYKLVKYTVSAGTILKIVANDKFQFQNNYSVPSSGVSNRIGDTYTAGVYYLVVPEGVTHLIFSAAISDGIADAYVRSPKAILLEKKIGNDTIIPILRNGSVGNSSNANSVSTAYIYPIDFTKEKIVVEYLGDASLANQYAWGYCLFRGATDGMLSTAAFSDSSITKYNYNVNATERVSVPKYELPTTKAVNYDHIMFYLFRYNNDTIVPLRIATDQYNFRITLKEKDGEQSQRDTDLAETKHDLLFAKHAKNNTGPQLTLLHFSDLHADMVALARIMKDAEGIEYDDAICTGDIVGNSAGRIESWWNESVLTCIGNHDSASYNSTDGYNWVALSMADRDAYYITPFKSNWGGVVHTSGKSYYYKDYADAKVRLIVMDAMLYSVHESDASLGTAQTAWLNSLLSSAISNNLHVLIAIHAPHGGATVEDCSFSRYNQAEMPTYNDCNTPQSIIDAVATAIGNGLHFIGYLVGHTHQDNVFDAEGDGKQLMYCITCAAVSNANQWKASDQHRDEENDAYNVVVVDTTNTLVKLIRGGGANMDDHMRTRKAICFDYSTGEMVGEIK
jgi:hypothetical protein